MAFQNSTSKLMISRTGGESPQNWWQVTSGLVASHLTRDSL
ncbi:unnamed protein product [Gulo gulo]|uniref:Uncharacterized protein n=1 Tax=Gulo gulo TaxID=48420 RepID=A0A9X9PVS8_GULGU|nr:unnamed protein product [Gulo gulo]